jgi:hypothetical protein
MYPQSLPEGVKPLNCAPQPVDILTQVLLLLLLLLAVRLSLLVLRPPLAYFLYQPQIIGDGDCGEIGGMKIGRQGKPKYSEKTCPTTNPT